MVKGSRVIYYAVVNGVSRSNLTSPHWHGVVQASWMNVVSSCFSEGEVLSVIGWG